MAKAKKKPFNKRIAQEIRAETNTTQAQIAKLAGVSISTVQKVETGESKNEKVLAIYNILNAEKEKIEEERWRKKEFFYRRRLKERIQRLSGHTYLITGKTTEEIEEDLAPLLEDVYEANESEAYAAYRKIREVVISGAWSKEWSQLIAAFNVDSDEVRDRALRVGELSGTLGKNISSDEVIKELIDDYELVRLNELKDRDFSAIRRTKAWVL